MKVYISGPITGRRKDDYMDHFQKAEDFINANGWAAVNPAKINEPLPEGTTHHEYMVVALAALSICDGVYMLEGWEGSSGAKVEYGFAKANNKFVMFEDNPRVEGGDHELEIPEIEGLASGAGQSTEG